jgi:hypothetical protein
LDITTTHSTAIHVHSMGCHVTVPKWHQFKMRVACHTQIAI